MAKRVAGRMALPCGRPSFEPQRPQAPGERATGTPPPGDAVPRRIETGTDSYRLATTRARAEQQATVS
ncbi:hypothetical protein ACIGO6_40940 [Streptomyces sp. NPDC053750]|uniref:hypothetical protein n=1 Tax=Streptomyces sp. NPDC053750 TaxID=3365714 RepID=UPI0037D5361D